MSSAARWEEFGVRGQRLRKRSVDDSERRRRRTRWEEFGVRSPRLRTRNVDDSEQMRGGGRWRTRREEFGIRGQRLRTRSILTIASEGEKVGGARAFDKVWLLNISTPRHI